jgi:hypothetical protein
VLTRSVDVCLLQYCRKAEDSLQNFFIAHQEAADNLTVTCDTTSSSISLRHNIVNHKPFFSASIMANADSPDPSKDLLPVDRTDEEVDPLAPAPEPKLPTRKDASLKEFLSKMDDYAPIVSELRPCMASLLT